MGWNMGLTWLSALLFPSPGRAPSRCLVNFEGLQRKHGHYAKTLSSPQKEPPSVQPNYCWV